MIDELIKERQLPPLKSREEMIEVLCREEYGIMPELKAELSVSDKLFSRNICLDTVTFDSLNLTINTPNGSHTLPIYRCLHNDGKPRPTLIFIDFNSEVKCIYFPIEIICEQNVNVISFNYKDATSDDGDFSTGLAPILLPNGQQNPTDIGKIGIWSWTAMRVLDYALTLPEIDKENIGIIGHSRLGKTALLTAMLDERIKFAFSNNAGCSGDMLARGSSGLGAKKVGWEPKRGENIEDMIHTFPYWFCKNYQKYAKERIPTDFDQHFLIASIAPRYAYAASSSLDDWADPPSVYLCLAAASEAWEQKGLLGFIHPDRFPEVGEKFHEGHVGYHIKHSPHLLSYHDWLKYIEFMKSKIK